jgi:hypothetical protein
MVAILDRSKIKMSTDLDPGQGALTPKTQDTSV